MNPHRQHHTPAPAPAPLRELAQGIALAILLGLAIATLLADHL